MKKHKSKKASPKPPVHIPISCTGIVQEVPVKRVADDSAVARLNARLLGPIGRSKS